MQRKVKRLAALLVCAALFLGGLALADDVTAAPTEQQTEQPTGEPTGAPEEEFAEDPTGEPTEEPTVESTVEPAEEPTEEPTEESTSEPTEESTEEPTSEPTEAPTEEPTSEPTEVPAETDAQVNALANDAAAARIDPAQQAICDQQGHQPEKYYFRQNYVASNAKQHLVYVQEITQCARCETILSVVDLPDPIYEDHDFASSYLAGRCSDCNYACPHENVTMVKENERDEWVSYTEGHRKEHLWEETYRCDVCKSTEAGYAKTERSTALGALEAHADADGDRVCDICGGMMSEYNTPDGKPAVQNCDHKGYTKTHVTYETYTADGDKCIGKGAVIEVWLDYGGCKTCGLMDFGVLSRTYDPDRTEVFAHDWKTVGEYTGGVCNYCGYIMNECAHTRLVREGEFIDNLVSGGKFVDAGDGTHSGMAFVNVEYRCYDCGTFFVRIEQEEYSEPHDFTGSDPTVCTDCGAKCDHKQEKEIDSWIELDYGDLEVVDDSDPLEHEIKAPGSSKCTRYRCEICGRERTEEVPLQGSFKEPHRWDLDGETGASSCYVCDYVNACKHPQVVDKSTYEDGTATDLGDEGHVFNRETMYKFVCATCGLNLTKDDFGYTGSYIDWETIKEAHTYVNGACTVCGRAEPQTPPPTNVPTNAPTSAPTNVPTSAPTSAPTANPTTGTGASQNGNAAGQSDGAQISAVQDEPKLTEVASSAVAPSVSAADGLRMGTALVEVAAAVEKQPGASVEIQGAGAVLTSDECAKFNALAPAERVLVILQMLGQDAEASNALSETGVPLSQEAQDLISTILARMAAMTPEEFTKLEGLFDQYFPVEIVNGANTLEITLEIQVNGEVHIERYSFTQGADGWMLAKIESNGGAAA